MGKTRKLAENFFPRHHSPMRPSSADSLRMERRAAGHRAGLEAAKKVRQDGGDTNDAAYAYADAFSKVSGEHASYNDGMNALARE